MRIARLDLRAYGHFANQAFDFGPEPSLHLIYGDNEAGKSTTLRALSSVLFGYPHEVVDGFKHDVKDIAISADLVAKDGSRLSFVRKRRGKNTLADVEGVPLDESDVAGFLGGVSKDFFEKVFALNHHRLHQHARALLAEGGSLGFSLAEAGSGIAGLKVALDRLKAERATLFLGSGSRPKLNQLIGNLTELRKEARRRTVSPHEYKKSHRQLQEIETDLKETRDRQKAIEVNIRRLQRIQKNLPLRAENEALSRKLEELSQVPLISPEASQQRIKAQTDHETAVDDLDVAQAAMAELNEKIVVLALDEEILVHREKVKRLAERRPVVENAEKDLPRREGELNQQISAARDLLEQVELAGDPQNLDEILLSTLKRRAIGTLIEEGTKLAAQRTSAAEQLEKASDDLKKAEQQAERAPKPREGHHLREALAAADRLGDITGDIARRRRTFARKELTLRDTIIGLGIASGEVSPLRVLAVPPDKTVERYAKVLDTLEGSISTARADIEHFDDEIRDVDDRISAMKMAGDVAIEDDLERARRARDDGWMLVRGLYIDRRDGVDVQAKAFAPDGRIADIYEKRVADADHVADVLRAHVEEATELSLLTRRKAELEAKKAQAQRQAGALGEQREGLLAEWRAAWPAGTITLHLPAEMAEWLARRADTLGEADSLDAERDEITSRVENEQKAMAGLISALVVFGAPAKSDLGLDALRGQARQALEQISQEDTWHERAKEALHVQTNRKAQAEQTVAMLDAQTAEWNAKWRAALGAAGLSPDLAIEAASVVLNVMNSLDVAKSQIDSLRRRVETMKNDRSAFQADVSNLAVLVAEASADDPVALCRGLEARLESGEAAERELKALKEQLKIRTTARDQAQSRLDRSKAILDSLCVRAGCVEPEELAEIEEKSSEKQQALRDRTALETGIRADGAGLSLEALFEECEGVVGDQIPGEIANLESEGTETEKRAEALMSNRANLKAEIDRLLAQDQAADFMQQAANVEAAAVAAVEAYVDLTLQETLLRQAIDLYRDRNQGPILGRAKNLFAELTDDAYTGLRADIDDKGQPILIAEHRTRGSLDVSALSDGTVDPLYLALRLAVVQEHNATREPLPFVADDLLLNFDDTRAQAALRALAHVAASNQVLFFTHHAHMIELARSAVPRALLVEHRLLGTAEVAVRAAE